MPRLLMIIAVVGLGIGPVPVAIMAAPLDGSAAIVCAGTEVRECEAGGECVRATAEEVNLPTLVRIDATKKLMSALGDGRSTPIHALERRDGRLVLYGGEAGRGWTLVIVEATGRMSGTVVDDSVSFVIFGTCAAP